MKKWLLSGAFCSALAIIGAVFIYDSNGNDALDIVFKICVCAPFFIMALFAFLGGLEISRNKDKAYAISQMDSGVAPICDLKMTLLSGLPSAMGAECRLVARKDTVTLMCGGRTYNIGMSQVRGIETFMEKETMKEFKMRPGRAIAGGILFGPVGAIIGGMPKSSDMEATDRMFFVLNYENSAGEVAFILLESPDFKIEKCMEDFQRYIPSARLEPVNL